MKIDRTTLLFFDSSCLIAAAGSPTGGSAFLLRLCALEFLKGAVSQAVLLEAERNIINKFPPAVLIAYDQLLVRTPLIVAPLPTVSKLRRYHSLINQKDEHVVVSAIATGARYLLTLDKTLAKQINQARLPIQALSPAEFIKTILSHHTDYPQTD